MSPTTEIVFESPEHHDLFCSLFPDQQQRVKLATDLIQRHSQETILSPSERIKLLASFVPEEEKIETEKFLSTLEQLRLSLIVNHDQVDFCFSLIYPTPKNQKLKKLLHLYLDSPLKNDLAQAYWNTLGELKDQSLPPLESPRIFIKAKSSTYLFSEWAQAHQYLQESPSTPIEFWELPMPSELSNNEEQIPQTASDSQILSKLALEIREKLSLSKRQIVGFGGAPHALLFFESKLKSLGIPFYSLFSGAGTPNSTAPVLLTPLNALPYSPHFIFWSYIDSSFFAAKHSLLLTEPELFTLMNGGFSIPRMSTDRIYLKTLLKELQKPGHQPIFLSNQTPIHDFDKTKELPSEPQTSRSQTELKLPPKKTTLSATQIDSYATCPTQYLVKHRLKLRPILPLEERYSLILGTAVHATLENFFKSNGTNLETLFLESLESICPEIRTHSLLFQQMLAQFTQMAHHFITLEETLKSRFGFTNNIALESKFETQIQGFAFTGKIDRIIETLNHSMILLDYKTGNVDFSPQQMATGKTFQALLYILAKNEQIETPCAGVLFYDLKNGEIKRGLLKEDVFPSELKKELTRGHLITNEKFSEFIELGKAHLIQFSQSIEQGQFEPTPNAVECSRCDVATFCQQGIGYV